MKSKANAPHPGVFIKEELEEREWSQRDLAYILGCSEQAVTIIINGKRSITPETAKALAMAFEVSPEFFTNLQQMYDLSRAEEPDQGIAIRQRFQSHYPTREMIKRGWITETKDSLLLEAQFMQFFGVDNLDDVPHLSHAARKSYYDKIPAAQLAWLFRVRNLARAQNAHKYSESSLREALNILKGLLTSPKEIRRIPSILSNAGVRFVIVEGLPSSKIDGVCFWLDEFSPVIGMSLRFDRIDNFWFVLRHEIEHVLREDGKDKEVIDIDVGGIESENLHRREHIANKEATEFLLPSHDLNTFIRSIKPYYSEKKVLEFARDMNVHPAIVIGQLQHRKEIGYGVFKKHMTKVKDFILGSTLVDGWGYIPK